MLQSSVLQRFVVFDFITPMIGSQLVPLINFLINFASLRSTLHQSLSSPCPCLSLTLLSIVILRLFRGIAHLRSGDVYNVLFLLESNEPDLFYLKVSSLHHLPYLALLLEGSFTRSPIAELAPSKWRCRKACRPLYRQRSRNP